MTKTKNNTTQKESSEMIYCQAAHLLEKSKFQDGALLKLGVLCYWRSFCAGNKDAALGLFEMFYLCDDDPFEQNLPLAYTFYNICQRIKQPGYEKYQDAIAIDNLRPYIDCAARASRLFNTANTKIGDKLLTFELNFDISLFYYNDIYLPQGITLSHAVLSKVNTEWNDHLKNMEDGLTHRFYDCDSNTLLHRCMHLSDEDDTDNQNAPLIGGESNHGCFSCIIL